MPLGPLMSWRQNECRAVVAAFHFVARKTARPRPLQLALSAAKPKGVENKQTRIWSPRPPSQQNFLYAPPALWDGSTLWALPQRIYSWDSDASFETPETPCLQTLQQLLPGPLLGPLRTLHPALGQPAAEGARKRLELNETFCGRIWAHDMVQCLTDDLCSAKVDLA